MSLWNLRWPWADCVIPSAGHQWITYIGSDVVVAARPPLVRVRYRFDRGRMVACSR